MKIKNWYYPDKQPSMSDRIDAMGVWYYMGGPISLGIIFTRWIIDRIHERKTRRISEEYTLVGGKKDGEYRSYYPNGQLKESTQYLNGALHGPSKAYYENGTLKKNCCYFVGKPDGIYEEYYENGQLAVSGIYFIDKKIGHWEEYYENGALRTEHNYYSETGWMDGPQRVYDEKGKLLSLSIYRNGMQLRGKEADEYLARWEEEELMHDPGFKSITDKLEHLTDDTYYPEIKPARTPERTEKLKKIIEVRRGAELLSSALKEAKAKNNTTLLSMLRRLARPFAEKEMSQRRAFSRIRELRKLRRKQK